MKLHAGLAMMAAGAAARIMAVEPPTMGWSSWNAFYVNISESIICDAADRLVSTGLADAGYRYVNIDDGYFGGRDEKTGRLKAHPDRFPNGLKPVVDHIHAKGLKAGIYSDGGNNTCGYYWNNDLIGRGVGMYGHDRQDADMFFKELGFDFIKVDFCGGVPQKGGHAKGKEPSLVLDPAERYGAIAEAIRATGRDDVRMNVCRWNYPGTWVRDVAASWRISQDIRPKWSSVKNIVEQSLYLSAYAGGGRYNDMDMLEVGRGMSDEEDRTHFGLWCIFSSPLLIGCDLSKMSPAALELHKNRELIAVNQDVLGLQAYVARHDAAAGTYVLVKDLESLCGLVRAVALYNPTDEARTVRTDAAADLDLGGKIAVRDLFAHRDLKPFEGSFSAEVPAHGVRIYRFSAERRQERTRYEGETGFIAAYQELVDPVKAGTGHYVSDSACSGGVKAANLGGSEANGLEWTDVRRFTDGRVRLVFATQCGESRSFDVTVNGRHAGRLTVPASAQGTVSRTSLEVVLKAGANSVRLSNASAKMPDVDAMYVENVR